MFLGDKNKQSDLLIPWCTYTEPEVAHVGKYEAELKEAGVEFESYMVRFFFHFVVDGGGGGGVMRAIYCM